MAEAARLGGFYHTHVRYPLGDGFLDPFREAIEIGRRGGAPVHITHFYHRATFPGPPEQMLGLVDDARAEGLDVTFDLYPYEWSSTRLLIMLPTWIQAGGVGPLKARLADRSARERIRAEMQARGRLFAGDRSWDALRLGAFTRPEHLAWEGRTLGDVMRETGRDAVDAICDLLLAEDLGVNQVTPGPHTDGIRAFLRHPQAMVGTDGVLIADKPSPRTYGSYPRILGQFVREERLLGLEEAVHRMTGMPAARLGLRRPRRARRRPRGGPRAVRPGHRPHARDLRRAAPVPDRDPVRDRQRRRWSIDDGEHTGATPGRALRRRRTAPEPLDATSGPPAAVAEAVLAGPSRSSRYRDPWAIDGDVEIDERGLGAAPAASPPAPMSAWGAGSSKSKLIVRRPRCCRCSRGRRPRVAASTQWNA